MAELETLFTANVQDFEKKSDAVDKTQKALAKSDPTITVKADTAPALKGMREIEDSAKKNGAAWEKTGTGMMVAGGVMAAGVGLAVKSFADFDASMSQVQSGTMASGKALGDLRAAAIDAGAKTQYSATEAADAITAMGKAGVSTKDILGGGLTGALSLAAAGQLEVGRAAEIAATSMVQFGLQGKDIPHIADLLAAGAGKAMGSVEELSGALKYAGVVAKGAGWSIEETTGVLAEFAQAGIVGEQAGTSLRGVIMAMEAPSKFAAKAMGDLGLNLYDANGHFLKAAPLAQALKDKLGPLDEATRNTALGTIFGNEQLTAAQVLYQGGAAAVTDWTGKVNDAGFAAEQAAMLTDNLKGDVERLGGSLSSVLIVSGSGANGMLRTMTQQLQGAVDLYGSMPAPVQTTATALGAVAAATLLVGGGLLVLAPRIAATKVALADMGRTGELMSSGLGKAATAGKMLGGPLIIATVALGYFAKQAQESKARVDELATSLDQQTGALTENTTAVVNKSLSDSGALGEAKRLGISVGDVTNAYLGNTDAATRVTAAVDAYTASLPDNRKGMLQAAETHHLLSNAISGGNTELDAAVEKTKLEAEANAAAIDPTTGLTGAQKAATAAAVAAKAPTQDQAAAEQDLAKAADAAKKVHDALTASITGFGSAMETARGDSRSYEAAIDAATAALKANGRTLDIGTEKGRNNQAALDGIATAALKAAESNLGLAEQNGKLGTATKTVTGDISTARQAFIDQAVAMGMPKKAAEALATQSGLTAGRVKEITNKLVELGQQNPKPKVTVLGIPAGLSAVDNLAARLKSLKDRHITVSTSTKGGVDPGYADGGTFHAADGRQSMIAPGGANILWAEPETGWETYISGKPSQRSRNIGLLAETARRFGLTVLPTGTTQYAGGSPLAASGSSPSLAGLSIEGTLDLGNGLVGLLRGVVKSELAETGAKLRYAGRGA